MDNLVHVSNTPIFDQLARERNYDRLVAGGPTIRLRPEASYISPDAWTFKPVPQLCPPVKGRNAKLSVNFHPFDIEKSHENLSDSVAAFVEDRKQEFFRKHPNAVDVIMTGVDEFDGTKTLTIEGYENTGVVITKKHVREHKTDPIPEKLADNQLALYRALAIDQSTIKIDPEPIPALTYDGLMEAVEKYIPEQTDESVNAASTDVTPRPQYAGPRPLWLIEDDADEE